MNYQKEQTMKNASIFISIFMLLTLIQCDGNSDKSTEPNNNTFNIEGVIGYWPLDGNAEDISGNSNNGIIVGAQHAVDKDGNPNKAFIFNGRTDYINFRNHTILKPNLPFSFSLWLKSDSDGRNHVFTTNFNDSCYYGFFFLIYNDRRIRMGYGDGEAIGASSNRCKYSANSINSNTWYHIVGVLNDSTDMDIYINGVNDSGTYAGYGASISYDSGNYNLGRLDTAQNDPPQYFIGSLDEIIFFNRALTEQEVQTLYQRNY